MELNFGDFILGILAAIIVNAVIWAFSFGKYAAQNKALHKEVYGDPGRKLPGLQSQVENHEARLLMVEKTHLEILPKCNETFQIIHTGLNTLNAKVDTVIALAKNGFRQ